MTTEHPTGFFSQALEGAKRHCTTMGLGVRHVGTDMVGKEALSRFECVDK